MIPHSIISCRFLYFVAKSRTVADELGPTFLESIIFGRSFGNIFYAMHEQPARQSTVNQCYERHFKEIQIGFPAALGENTKAVRLRK